MNLQEFRAKYPEYDDLSDGDLIQGLHDTYYSDIPVDKFNELMGYSPYPSGEPGTFSGVEAETGGPISVPEQEPYTPETTGVEATWKQPETPTTTTQPEQLQSVPGEPEKVTQSKNRINELVKGLTGVEGSFREPPAEPQDIDLFDSIAKHEGFSLTPYKDTEGHLTIGYGHKLKPNEGYMTNGISKEMALQLYNQDIAIAEKDARALVPNFDQLDPERQKVLTEMAYNLGRTRLSGFEKMLGAVAENDFVKAGDEMMDSVWATQVKGRANTLASRMRAGSPEPPEKPEEPYDLAGVGLDVGEYSGPKAQGEVALSLLTGMLAAPTAGVAALVGGATKTAEQVLKGAVITNAVKSGYKWSEEVFMQAAKDLSYEPRNKSAQKIITDIAQHEPFNALAHEAGNKVLEKYPDNPELATLVHTAIATLPVTVPFVGAKITAAIEGSFHWRYYTNQERAIILQSIEEALQEGKITAGQAARKSKSVFAEELAKRTTGEAAAEKGQPPPPVKQPVPETAQPAPEPGPEQTTSPALVEGGKPQYPGKPKPPVSETEMKIIDNLEKQKRIEAEEARKEPKKVPKEEITRQEDLGRTVGENRREFGEKGDKLFVEYMSSGKTAAEARSMVRKKLTEPEGIARPEILDKYAFSDIAEQFYSGEKDKILGMNGWKRVKNVTREGVELKNGEVLPWDHADLAGRNAAEYVSPDVLDYLEAKYKGAKPKPEAKPEPKPTKPTLPPGIKESPTGTMLEPSMIKQEVFNTQTAVQLAFEREAKRIEKETKGEFTATAFEYWKNEDGTWSGRYEKSDAAYKIAPRDLTELIERAKPLRVIEPKPWPMKGKATPLKTHNAAKQGVLAAIDQERKAIGDKGDEKRFIRFIDPVTGTEMDVKYTKKALDTFYKEYKKGVTAPGSTPAGVGKVSTPTQKAVAGNKEAWGDGYKQVGEWATTTHFIVKGKPPKNAKIDDTIPSDQSVIDGILQGAEKAHDAVLRYYAVVDPVTQVEGVSKTPVAPTPDDPWGPYVVFRDETTQKRYTYAQSVINSITNRHPDATWRIDSEGKRLFAMDGEQPVGVAMSLMTFEETPPAADLAKEAGLYNIGEFSDAPVIMELPELVQLTRGLMNRDPILLRAMPPNVLGAFSPFFEAIVMPKYGPAKWGFEQMTKTLAHELGHVIDWLPDKYLGRGNILGRIAKMTETYKKETLPFKKGAPGELTQEDRDRIQKEAERLAKAEGEELIDEEITRRVAVDPEDVLAILKGLEAKGELSPELVHFIFTASTAVKKSIALQAMKGMSPAELSHLSSIITERTGKKIPKGVDPAKIKAKYEELLKKEIAKRRLWTLEEIEKELKKHTAEWRPYTRGASHKYDAYRDTPQELYADAISALLVSPETLRRNAPKFYEAFFNWVEENPDFSKEWQAIQAKIRGGRQSEVTDARIEQDAAMFRRASEIANELHNKKSATIESSYDTLMRGLWDSKHGAIHQIRLWENKGGILKRVAKNMRWELEEMEYIASEVSQYAYEYDKIFTGPMEEAGLTMDDLGSYALRKHIAENRQEIFSAQGYTPKTASDDLMEMKTGRAKGWTPEKYKAAEKLIKQYRQLRERFVIPLIEQAGLATPELIEIIQERIWYQKMAVQRFMNKQYGLQGGSRIYRQVGDLGEVKNPLVATYLQDLSLIRAARINIAKTKFYMLGKIEKILEPTKMKWTGLRQEPAPHSDRNMELMSIMTRGKVKYFYAPAVIAESFKKEPFMAMQLVGLWNVFVRPLRAILVNKNPIWMARNVPRDFTESLKKNPEIKLRHTGRLLKMYAKAWPEAWRDVFKNIRSEDVRTMYKDRMLLTDRVWASHELNFEDEIERMASSFALSEVADKESNWAVARWRKFIRYLDKWGRMSEILSKIAGYKYLKAYTDMPHKEIGHRVRTRIGTPDVKRQGSWQTVTNNLFMFSNVGKEGIRANIEAFRENKGTYIWKTLAINILPKLILAAGAAGLFGIVSGVYHRREEEKDKKRAAQYWKMLIDAIPEYDKAMYTIIPLYLDEKYRAHYLRIPQDYEGQYFGALFWKMLNLKIVGENGAISTISNINPYQLNPYLEVGGVVADYYLRGQNPVDDYRGRFILNDRTFAVGGKYAAKELGKYVWKNLGMSIFYNPEYGDIVRQRDDSEDFLRTFPGNILGTFYKVSDQGLYENALDHLRLSRKGKAEESLELDRQLADLTTEEKGMLLQWVAPQYKTRIRKMMQREENSALMRSLASARSKEETLMVLQLFYDQLEYEESGK